MNDVAAAVTQREKKKKKNLTRHRFIYLDDLTLLANCRTGKVKRTLKCEDNNSATSYTLHFLQGHTPLSTKEEREREERDGQSVKTDDP